MPVCGGKSVISQLRDIEDAEFIGQAASLISEDEFDADSWSAWTRLYLPRQGRRARPVYAAGKALTGQSHGPDMGQLLPFIGRQTALARLQGKTA